MINNNQMTARQPLPVLSVKGLVKSRAAGKAEAYSLRVPLLEVRRGDKILLTGPSGSGKSTLLDMLGMVLKPDAVEEFLFRPGKEQGAGQGAGQNSGQNSEQGAGQNSEQGAGQNSEQGAGQNSEQGAGRNVEAFDVAAAWRAGDMEKPALWRRSLGYVLQTGGLLPFLNVRENIRCQRRLLALPPDAEDVDKLVEELKIGHLLSKLPTALSVGERQRVAIARALAANPVLVLADEPTAALDPENAATVLAMFARAVSERGAPLIMVSHAPEQLRGMNFRRFAVRTARNEDGVLAVLQPLPATEGKP